MRTKPISLSLVGAAALALAIAPMGIAQTEAPERSTEQAPVLERDSQVVTGKIAEVTPEQLTITTDDGERMSFATMDDFTAGDEPLVVGDRVRIEYEGEVDLEAVRVSILPEGMNEPAVPAVTAETEPEAELAEEEEPLVADNGHDHGIKDNGVEAAVADNGAQQPRPTQQPRRPTDPQRAQERAPANRELPNTAGPLPALVLIGLALLGGGIAISRRRH